MKCHYCKTLIPKTSARKISHENITISEEPLWFCTKQCYERWLAELNSDTVKTYFIWTIERILNRMKFIKKIIQVKGISDEYGPSTEDTHFAAEL